MTMSLYQVITDMPITKLQHQMGHKDIRTTLRYVHQVPNYQGLEARTNLFADLRTDHDRNPQ